jgi:hypothetical protein
MIIVPFAPGHYAAADWGTMTEGLGHMDRQRRERKLQAAKAGMAFTVFNEGELVCSAGLAVLWPGVAEAWALFTPLVKELTREMIRVLKRGLEELAGSLKLHRIQTAVQADFLQGRKFIQVLGFKEEGHMEKYGADGADYFRYVRLT